MAEIDQPPTEEELTSGSNSGRSSDNKKISNCEIAVGTIIFLLYVTSLLLFCLFFIGQVSSSSSNSNFKWACVSVVPADQYCFIAIGRFSVGLISIGQFAIGLITVSQVGASLVAGLGQFQITLGVAIAQLSVGTFIPLAQLGLASFKVVRAQCGWQLRLMNRRKPFFVSCCKRT